VDHFHTNLIARACLLALIVPSAVSAQWRINASGSSEIDEMRFDLPEQAHEFLRDYRINELASTHSYVSEKLYPSETYSDGRLISWLCMYRSDAPGSYDPDTCYFGALSGTTLTKFIIPGEMTDSPLLNRDLGKPETELCVGNPINLATGNKYQQETDYVSAGMEPLVFTRHYNSQLALSGKQSDVGIGWSHNYSNKVIFDKESHGENMVVLHRPDGKELAFYRTNAVWMPTWKSDDRLYKDSGWRYQRADGVVELYDSNGQLIRIVHPSGNELDLNYTNGKLDSVSDSFGRTLSFSYDQGKIIKMIDPAGQIFSYDYSNELLVAVHKPDANQRRYHYEDSLNPSLLTSLTDEKGSRFATWSYDPSGRAVLSEHSSGVDRTSVTYNPDGSVTVTNALGHEQHYLFSRYNGKLKPDSIQGAACTGFAGGTKSFGYDTNGELKSIINEEGQSFSYQYDQRGLEISRTRSTGDTITTQWHSEFPKPTKITSSYLVQEFTYDDHQRLLTLKLIDRTNSDVRQWTFEYYPDALGVPGQLKSVDGPRVDVDDVTRFEYDAQANLSRVINSLGHVVSFDNYDAHGRAQSVTDANGVSYSLNYNTLGQLISSTGPDGTTLYSYDESGLLVCLESFFIK
jgi:YD repeat-containing protein